MVSKLTKRALAASLKKLLAQKPLSKITIAENSAATRSKPTKIRNRFLCVSVQSEGCFIGAFPFQEGCKPAKARVF